MTDPNGGIFLDDRTFQRLKEVAVFAKRVDACVLRPQRVGGPWRVRQYGRVVYEHDDLEAVADWLTA